MFLCFREDLDSIVIVPVSFEQRDAMIEEDPATFYTTDHHRSYPLRAGPDQKTAFQRHAGFASDGLERHSEKEATAQAVVGASTIRTR